MYHERAERELLETVIRTGSPRKPSLMRVERERTQESQVGLGIGRM